MDLVSSFLIETIFFNSRLVDNRIKDKFFEIVEKGVKKNKKLRFIAGNVQMRGRGGKDGEVGKYIKIQCVVVKPSLPFMCGQSLRTMLGSSFSGRINGEERKLYIMAPAPNMPGNDWRLT